MEKEKIIIIGAGPAGLAAAYKILDASKNKYDVTILEGTDSIGGISRTVEYKGNRMDIGGHRFFTKNTQVNDFWNKIMPLQGMPAYDDKILNITKPLNEGGPNPETEDCVMLIRNRVSRIYYNKKFFDYPITLKFATFKNMGAINTIKTGFSYTSSMIFKKKEDNLENFFINRFGKKLYGMFFESYTEKLWGRHPREIDASWGSQRVKGVSISAVLKNSLGKLFKKNRKVETSLIEEFSYPKYGPGHFYETVAREIEKMGGTILKNHSVINVNCEKSKVVGVSCSNNVTLSCDYLLSSMPIKNLITSFTGVKPSKDVMRIAEGLPYRDFITAGLLLKKLNLKNETKFKTINNMIPDNWVYVHDSNIRMIRFQVFNNWSPYMVKKVEEHIWVGLEYVCSEDDDLWAMSEDSFKEFAIQEFVKMNLIEKNDVVDATVVREKKAYPAYFDTYKEFDHIIDYLNKFDNLFCIGRNGQHRYNNMDHSILTGFIAAESIMTNNKDKTVLWNVNSEKEYHEETKK